MEPPETNIALPPTPCRGKWGRLGFESELAARHRSTNDSSTPARKMYGQMKITAPILSWSLKRGLTPGVNSVDETCK